jgi:hypothetical protein
MVRTAVAPVLLVALAAGCGSAHPVPPATNVQGPGFHSAAGWHVLGYGLSQPPNAPDASAANVPFARADRSQSAPTRTEASLPRRGILIWAQLQPRWPQVDRRFPVRKPILRDAVPTSGMEGFGPAGTIRRLEARTAGYDVDVLIFFGAKHPSAAVVAATNRELRRLFFPGCPRSARPLDGGDPGTAARATLEWLRESAADGFGPALRGAQAAGSIVSGQSSDPQLRTVGQLCGKKTQRIVAVRVTPSKLGRSELGPDLLFFVAKTPRGWLVWREGAT